MPITRDQVQSQFRWTIRHALPVRLTLLYLASELVAPHGGLAGARAYKRQSGLRAADRQQTGPVGESRPPTTQGRCVIAVAASTLGLMGDRSASSGLRGQDHHLRILYRDAAAGPGRLGMGLH